MKKAYVYGMAGLVTAAVGVTAASGVFDGAETAASAPQAPVLANAASAAPKPAPVQAVTPPAATVHVVPDAPAAPAAKPAPVAKTTRSDARTVAHRPRPAVVRA